MIAAKIFTFHNVSINSINGLISSVTQNSFTFHNVSINSMIGTMKKQKTMIFTFHNVSINSTTQPVWHTSDTPIYIP